MIKGKEINSEPAIAPISNCDTSKCAARYCRKKLMKNVITRFKTILNTKFRTKTL